MKNFNIQKENIKKWDTTLYSYIDWISKSKLRKFFSDEIKIKDFSLWWATSICAKNNVDNNKWYINLKDCLVNKQKFKYSKLNFYLLFILRFWKNFISHLLWYSIIKLISYTRLKKIKRKNCFHSMNTNFINNNNNNTLFDRSYGKAPFYKQKNENFYLVSIAKKKKFFSNFLKSNKYKENIPVIIADEYLPISIIFSTYFYTLINFFKLAVYLNKNKNIFLIKNINCKNILEPFLLMSFSGEIQKNIFNGLCIKYFLKKNETVKLLMTYGEFNPGARTIYHFARLNKNPPKIVAIQHGHAVKNLMFFFHKKSEFTNNQVLEGLYYSPSPDFYLTQGVQYQKILKEYFPKKTKVIGPLKDHLNKLKKNINRKKLEKIKNKNDKKIILLCPTGGDEWDILSYIKSIVDYNFRYILSPHWGFNREEVIETYLKTLKGKCDIEIYNDLSTIDLLSISNFAICGWSSIAYEALFFNVQPIRLINSNKPPHFDLKDKLPIPNNSYKLKKMLNEKSSIIKKTTMNQIMKDYLYKLDNKTHERFWAYIKNI